MNHRQDGAPAPDGPALAKVKRLRAEGDAHMRAARHAAANSAYADAWGELANDEVLMDRYGRTQAFWLLMSGMDASFRNGDMEAAFNICALTLRSFVDDGLVVGNPFFHLRVGQIKLELTEDSAEGGSDEGAVDDLARALIGGGIEVFRGEDPEYLTLITGLLEPPEGYGSWDETAGRDEAACRNLLNGAEGFLLEQFTWKFGKPPPYPDVTEE